MFSLKTRTLHYLSREEKEKTNDKLAAFEQFLTTIENDKLQIDELDDMEEAFQFDFDDIDVANPSNEAVSADLGSSTMMPSGVASAVLEKGVDVSDKRLTTSENSIQEKALGDVAQKRDLIKPVQLSTEAAEVKPSFGFSTASGKGVEISAKALQEGKAIMNKPLKNLVLHGLITPSNDVKEEAKSPLGFSTASGKGVDISAKALQEGEAIMNKPFKNSALNDLVTPNVEVKEGAKSILGFSTASGKGVDISAKAIEEGKAILNKPQTNSNIKGLSMPPHLGTELMAEQMKPSLGYNTASGKGVNISEKAILAGKSMMAKTGTNGASSSSTPVLKTTSRPALAFGTGKDISAEALNAVKNTTQRDRALKGGSSLPSLGFNTASGKGVSISKEALKAGKTLMAKPLNPNPEDNCLKPERSSNNSLASIGFNTAASGKGVSIFKNALDQAKLLLNQQHGETPNIGANDVCTKGKIANNKMSLKMTTSLDSFGDGMDLHRAAQSRGKMDKCSDRSINSCNFPPFKEILTD